MVQHFPSSPPRIHPIVVHTQPVLAPQLQLASHYYRPPRLHQHHVPLGLSTYSSDYRKEGSKVPDFQYHGMWHITLPWTRSFLELQAIVQTHLYLLHIYSQTRSFLSRNILSIPRATTISVGLISREAATLVASTNLATQAAQSAS